MSDTINVELAWWRVHPKTEKVYDYLKARSEPGSLVKREELEAIVGSVKAGESGYGYVRTAIRKLLREHKRHWKRVHDGNYRCLVSQDTVNVLESRREQIRRRSRDALRESATIVVAELTDGERPHVTSLVAQLGALQALSTSRTTKALESNGQKELDLKRLLDNMK